MIDADARTPWLASVFVSGPSLGAAVETVGVLDEALLRRLAAGPASALAEIHGKGLVHRDLKPDNVLLAEDGVRVVDLSRRSLLPPGGRGAGRQGRPRPWWRSGSRASPWRCGPTARAGPLPPRGGRPGPYPPRHPRPRRPPPSTGTRGCAAAGRWRGSCRPGGRWTRTSTRTGRREPRPDGAGSGLAALSRRPRCYADAGTASGAGDSSGWRSIRPAWSTRWCRDRR